MLHPAPAGGWSAASAMVSMSFAQRSRLGRARLHGYRRGSARKSARPGAAYDSEMLSGTINMLCSQRYTDIGEGTTYRSTWLDMSAWPNSRRLGGALKRDPRKRAAGPLSAFSVFAMTLAANLARRERGIRRRSGCRVDIGIGGI
jgi:hypothetical protein